MAPTEIRFLTPGDIGLLWEIDRSEQLEVEYTVESGRLVSSKSDVYVPPWDPSGSGGHGVTHLVAFCDPLLDRGAQLLGAYDEDAMVGMALVEPSSGPARTAHVKTLHVMSAAHRA